MSARSITAMRMATPLVTCSRMADCGAVGDAGGDLHAANDGAGMHDDCGGRECGEPLAGELIAGLVLLEIELQTGEALGLNAQHHDGLRLAHGGFKVALDLDAGAGCAAISGRSSLGPQSRTRAPRRGSSSMLERATRL